jgi:NTP pyrophosphatase (non-canonical NTP hydrolase)
MDKSLIQKILKFRDDRDWKQFHNEKDLAISISLEAAELLENFQWSTSEEALLKNRQNILEELADIIMYSVLLSDKLNVDLNEIVLEKLKKNINKYPVEKAFGKKEKYNEL